jgi:hypothetical protein
MAVGSGLQKHSGHWMVLQWCRKCSTLDCVAAVAQLSRLASDGAPRAAPQLSQKYVVCNADEGDSGTFSDRMTMEGDPYMLIEGMAIAGLAVGCHPRLHLHSFGIPARHRRP